MANLYMQKTTNNYQTRFDAAPMSQVEFSRMTANPTHLTTLNAGDIVPIYCAEVLPNDTFDISMDFVIRQTTVLTPTMSQMDVDYYAFFVPNRVVNKSWKNVNGENTSGRWVAPDVSLVPLMRNNPTYADGVQVPVGSVADYYGFPTQQKLPLDILMQCNDLKFRGYLECYNQFFRDQNFSAPIPYSKLNIYNGFFEPVDSFIPANGTSGSSFQISSGSSDGTFAKGAIINAVYGDGATVDGSNNGSMSFANRRTSWSALSAPLKANKKHDYFTSVLPSPQKGRDVIVSIGDTAALSQNYANIVNMNLLGTGNNIPSASFVNLTDNSGNPLGASLLGVSGTGSQMAAGVPEGVEVPSFNSSDRVKLGMAVDLRNITADLANASGVTLNDLRMGAAIQQTFELMARGGTRYREYVKTFFGIEADDPFKDIPTYLGHFRRGLDLYQTAQTSASSETPQGNLAAFGYTNDNGHLFTQTFLEHGYVHIFAVIRQQNVYSSYLAPDNFRLNHLDWYIPTLANISEQPVWSKYINPFGGAAHVFGYQEAWAEYRHEQSVTSGALRSGAPNNLDIWTYADEFDSTLTTASDEWLKSNAAEVLDRSLAVTSDVAPQFKAQFIFHVTKQRPMPTYSVPGLDVL